MANHPASGRRTCSSVHPRPAAYTRNASYCARVGSSGPGGNGSGTGIGCGRVGKEKIKHANDESHTRGNIMEVCVPSPSQSPRDRPLGADTGRRIRLEAQGRGKAGKTKSKGVSNAETAGKAKPKSAHATQRNATKRNATQDHTFSSQQRVIIAIDAKKEATENVGEVVDAQSGGRRRHKHSRRTQAIRHLLRPRSQRQARKRREKGLCPGHRRHGPPHCWTYFEVRGGCKVSFLGVLGGQVGWHRTRRRWRRRWPRARRRRIENQTLASQQLQRAVMDGEGDGESAWHTKLKVTGQLG